MNKIILMGRLVSNPDIRVSSWESHIIIAKYTLAVKRNYKRENEVDVDFINCVAFGKLAEFAERYLYKGRGIAIIGRLQTGSYEKAGVKHYITDVIVE